jgi:hypothetical protein
MKIHSEVLDFFYYMRTDMTTLMGVFFHLFVAFIRVQSTKVSSELKMEAEGSSEMSVRFYQTTWCHIPEDNTFLCPEVLSNSFLRNFPIFLTNIHGVTPDKTVYFSSLKIDT